MDAKSSEERAEFMLFAKRIQNISKDRDKNIDVAVPYLEKIYKRVQAKTGITCICNTLP